MTLAQAVQSDGLMLRHAAHRAVVDALNTAWQHKRARSPRRTEPEYVACLTLFAAPAFAADWRQILQRHGVQLAAASVFCHARPIVDTGDWTDPELGDILFVHRHEDARGNVRRNALLFQAKVSSSQPHAIGKKERHQLRLYQGWPDFKYVTPGSLKGEDRQIQPKRWHRGGQYLQIDERPPSDPQSGLQGPPSFPAGVCLPQDPLVIHMDLASELLVWLSGFSGRPFRDWASAATTKGWSRVVWDLLRESLGAALRWKRAFYRGRPRYSGDNIHLLYGAFGDSVGVRLQTIAEVLGNSADSLGEPPPDADGPPPQVAGYESDAGIAIVIIETIDRDQHRD